MVGTPGGTPDKPATFFASAEEFREWLEANHETATELWMGLNKKHVPDRGLTWDEAVPEALCFGWIDSVAQRIDEDAVRQRWTPRKSSSVWSTINIAHVERLVAEGKMRPAGLAAYEKRKPERSGIYAYEAGGSLSDEQRARLLANPAAAAFWEIATAVLSQGRGELGRHRQARGDPREPARAADRGLGRGPADQVPALRRRAEVGGSRSGGSAAGMIARCSYAARLPSPSC